MTRGRILMLGLVVVFQTVYGQYGENPYLNGYRNDDQVYYADQMRHFADNPFLQHAISSRQINQFMGPGYLPPVERQQLICSGQQVCVNRNSCYNGFFTQGSPGSRQDCDIDTEVCCSYRPPPPPPQPTERPSTPCSGNNNACVPPQQCIGGFIQSNGLLKSYSSSGKCYAPEVCCRVPEPESTVLTNSGYVVRVPEQPFPVPRTTRPPPPPPVTRPPQIQTRPPPIQTRPPVFQTRPPVIQTRPPPPPPTRPTVNPTYLPPVRQTRPPLRGEGQLSPPIFPQVPVENIAPPTKCAAALNCTEIQFCSSTGVISKTPVVLTREQELFRVPLTDCQDEQRGFIGKCCRDPDYVDPWPVSQLGRYDAALFGDDGSYKPPQNQPRRPAQPVAQPSVISGSAVLSLPIPPQPNQIDYQYPPPSGKCTDRNRNGQPRGEGPYDAAFSEFPWQIMVLLESTKSLLCGGALIAEDLVATAAHCVQGRKPYDVLIKGGEWKLGRDEEPLNFELMRVVKIESHPKYDPSSKTNDMALLFLENKLPLNTHIAPICIDDQDPLPSEECVTTGWGKVALRLHAQDAIMHYSPISVFGPGQCSQGAVCGSPSVDACELDQGSALACASNGKYVMKGTFISEDRCGDGGVITFTKPDVQWINNAKNRKRSNY